MKLLMSFVLLLILATSCFGEKIKSNLTTKDQVSYPQLINDKLDNYPLEKLPFSIDSSFFVADSAFNFASGNLTIEEVKLLSSHFATDEVSSREKHYLNDFYKIAQSKLDENFEALQQNVDMIGMTENAVCNAIGRLEFGDTMALVLWEIIYKSYDACPFYSGHHFLGSLVKDGKVISCMHLASRESGADAPMSFEMYQLASIAQNAVITIRNHSQAKEMDSLVEQSHNFLKYKINNKGFVTTK